VGCNDPKPGAQDEGNDVARFHQAMFAGVSP
jgi:hypothetical protein